MPGQMNAAAWGLLALLSVIWGASFFFAAVALQGFPPFTIVLGRCAVAALALALACRLSGFALPRGRQAWIVCLGMGFLNNALPFSLITTGQQYIPSGLAAVVNAATPVFGALAAHLLTQDEKLTAHRLAGSVLGLAGVAVLAGPAAFAQGNELLGILCGLGACLSYGLTGVWSRRIRRAGLTPLAVATGQCASATLMMLPLVLLLDQPWTLPAPPATAVLAVIGFGLISTALAYWLFFVILARAGAANVLLVTLLVPVTALLIGSLVLQEVLLPRHFAGMAIIFAGLIVIDGRLLRRWS